jgi:hypothetical protein
MKDGFYYCCSCRIGVGIEHTTLNILVVLVGNSQVQREIDILSRIVRIFYNQLLNEFKHGGQIV